MQSPDLKHYKTPDDNPWFPHMMFRVSGLVVDGDAESDTICRSPAQGTFLSVYVLDEVYPDSGLLLRFGEELTEGGYLVAEADAIDDIHRQLSRAEILPGWTPPTLPGKLAVTDDVTDRIDRRDISMEMYEALSFKPIMTNPQAGIEIAAPARVEKGAQVELTDTQVSAFNELLETYLADPESTYGNTPEAMMIEPDGQQHTISLTNYA